MSIIAIIGIFALAGSLLSQVSMDLQTSFGAKGGEPGCGENQEAIDASKGKCVKEVEADDDVVSGGDDVNSGVNEDNQSCQVCSGN